MTTNPKTVNTAPRPGSRISSMDPIQAYLERIGDWPLLSHEDEKRLGLTMTQGRVALKEQENAQITGVRLSPARRRMLQRQVREMEEARERFINTNLRLVVDTVKRYQFPGIDMLDLIQEGNIGLVKAVDKWDHKREFRFSTYAVYWIRQAISRGGRSASRSLAVPVFAMEEQQRVRRLRSGLVGLLGREPTVDELAAHASLTIDRLTEILALPEMPLSLHETTGDHDSPLHDLVADDTVSPEDLAVNADTRRLVREALRPLDDTEFRVISLRFGLGDGEARTLQEVGELVGIGRERVRQIESRSIAKLLHPRDWHGLASLRPTG